MNAFTEGLATAFAVLGGKINELDNELSRAETMIAKYDQANKNNVETIQDLTRKLNIKERKDREKTEGKK